MDTASKFEFFRQAHMLVKKIRWKTLNSMDLYQSEDFHPTDFRVLSVLDFETGKSIGAIAEKWTMQYSNVTNIVNKLVKLGYANKKKDEVDKRKTLVYITPEGDEVRKKGFAQYEKKITEYLENVSDETISDALKAINEILGQCK